MIHQVDTPNTFHPLPSSLDLELLTALLEPEDGTYPWNTADEETEAYFSQLEQQCPFADFLTEEPITRTENFYNHLDTLWSAISPTQTNHQLQQVVNHLQQSLHQAFAAFIPSAWLNTIANQASELFKLEHSTGEKLVSCVQSLLPDWQSDDLLVLARPYAYAMRSNTIENEPSIINTLNDREWSNLSEIEQAKVTLAIAHYAFQVLQEIDTEI
ncbi:MAG TPA: hypothetical protein VK203_29035 [Nostocaceae cyanobacterium]|nr:hypothetical protein [Nostocaceae cyanobacterium]